MKTTIMKPRFRLGRVVGTPVAVQAIVEAGQTPDFFLRKHVAGDWGDCCEEDRQVNNDALKHGGRILSVYTTLKGVRIWIITEYDRSVTTVLLPDEY
jgi:hypothetical protein